MHFLDVLYRLWPIVVGMVVVGIVLWRTRSPFFIFHQFLKWLALEGKYSNPDQKVAYDYLDLNKFNLKTGFQLRSAAAKTRLQAWMREHDFVLRRAGWYFKANRLRFQIPQTKYIVICRAVVISMGAAFVVGGQFVETSDCAPLKFNATGTWVWDGNNEAYSLRFDFPKLLGGDPWWLQQRDCRYEKDPTPLNDI